MKAVVQSCPPYGQGAQLMVVSAPSLFAKAWVTPGSSQPTPERLQLLNQSINQCYTCSYEAQKAHASHSLTAQAQ
jgi:hypothetical protein